MHTLCGQGPDLLIPIYNLSFSFSGFSGTKNAHMDKTHAKIQDTCIAKHMQNFR